jgi:SNF2 family DNA or RNA helicase
MDTQANKYRAFRQLVNSFYNEELQSLEETEEEISITKNKVTIEPKIIYDKLTGDIKLEVYIGDKNLYKIKELSKFYDAMFAGKSFKYGTNMEFVHTRETFEEKCLPFLDFVLKYAEVIKYVNAHANSDYRFGTKALSESSIALTNSGFDDIFEILKGKIIKFKRNTVDQMIEFVPDDPNIEFNLEKISENEYRFSPNIDLFKINIIKGNKYNYVLTKNKMYRCSEKYENTTMKLVKIFRENFIQEAIFGEKELSQLFSIIIPKVQDNIIVQGIDRCEIEKYLPKMLMPKLYLDIDKNNYIIAELKFCYGDNEYSPLDENIKKEKARNMIEETKALNILRKTGFMLDGKNARFVLPNEEKIYNFITRDINMYMEKFEVMVTDNFKTKQVKESKACTVGVKIENDLLKIDLDGLDIDAQEIKGIMEKYKLKKKYYRLKDGSFINLEENQTIEFLDKLITGTGMSYKEFETGSIRLPVYRTLYLNQLLESLPKEAVTKDKEYKELVKELDKEKIDENIKFPKGINANLRYYQETGYKWLKILDKYKFGGILADDMGLGKTLQLLSVIQAYVEQTDIEERRPSLVISPSSLALNWQAEAEKFAKDLKTLVIHGKAQERKNQIEKIGDYDLVITSYDLLKRDIEVYNEQGYVFRYVIADEAQYLKNSNTQNAISIKQIKADAKYALTGTPMENSLAELWSIFDFIMPEYLFNYRKFKAQFEIPIVKEHDRMAMEKLKMLIEPFILRRTKKEVLTELPEKTVTVLTSKMQEEQEKIYLSYMLEAREEVSEAIDLEGYEKSQMKILAVLTRLRQICCHPSLFIENYKGSSSKLEQCMELLKEGVESGHKILLFSGYTSMFNIIEKELEKYGIKYFKLTGSTKVSERVKLVDEFNENEDVKVFLISLKAGGTGLNLTGADMVIHYDPWWNASAENQATDRAYRIGQKKNVQVYKLITKDSIEEKIYDLQKNKSALIDNMLDINTAFINRLSKEEILDLFN